MSIMQHIATGRDNKTFSIGRVLSLIVFAAFVIGLPSIAVILMATGKVDRDSIATIFDKLQVYVPAMLLSVAGLIGLTAPSEPKADS